jgi:ATP-binding cassette subfamily B protein
MLRVAPVLVLDEPTVGLDAGAVREVMEPLRRLAAGRTTVLISHDLALAPLADRVVVVDGGRVVETGTHAELAGRRGGVYAGLWGAGESTSPPPPLALPVPEG